MRNEALSNKLKEKGYKLTSQRRAVLDIVLENISKHLNSQEIYELVRSKHPEIGVATVYRTLPILEELGYIYSVDFGDGCTRYEVCKEGEKHRHHRLICTKCGKIIEVNEDLLGEIEKNILNNMDFIVKDHMLKFYGICSDCRKK